VSFFAPNLLSTGAPPSALPGISPQGVRSQAAPLSRFLKAGEYLPETLQAWGYEWSADLTPWGEMPGRAEGGAPVESRLAGGES
jgi:hypothetical protein